MVLPGKANSFSQTNFPKKVNNSFSTLAGLVLNYQEQFILVWQIKSQMEDLTRKNCMRIGLDNIYGFVEE